VLTTGLGIFTGEVPVIYIPLLKNPNLIAFHGHLWERLNGVGIGASHYYSPRRWAPHITLAHGDVDQEALVCALAKLAFREFNWEIIVDNLAFAYQPEDKTGWTKYRFPFLG
jgi:2'-5' RNA ligase